MSVCIVNLVYTNIWKMYIGKLLVLLIIISCQSSQLEVFWSLSEEYWLMNIPSYNRCLKINCKIFVFKNNNAPITAVLQFMWSLCFGKHFASRITGVAL